MGDCVHCAGRWCEEGKDCSAVTEGLEGVSDESLEIYRRDPETGRMAEAAAGVEEEGYMKLTRFEELMAFSRKMGYRKIGVAFCAGLADEARKFVDILSKGFEVYSVICKNCGIEKSDVAGGDHSKGSIACNPVGQALVLNRIGTDLNVIFGLCMGHDVLFSKYSEAPVTTFIVKDRVMAHNPIGAIYSRYYSGRLESYASGEGR